MPYVPPVDWEDTPCTDTPLNDTNITAMETALAAWATYGEFRVNTTPVASATSIDPPDNYLVHTVSGTADIETIATQAAGKMIVLLFSGDAATAGWSPRPATWSWRPASLYVAGDSITLVCDGTDWIEIGRNSAVASRRLARPGGRAHDQAQRLDARRGGSGLRQPRRHRRRGSPDRVRGDAVRRLGGAHKRRRRRHLGRHGMKTRQALGVVEHGNDPKAQAARRCRCVLWIGKVKPEKRRGPRPVARHHQRDGQSR